MRVRAALLLLVMCVALGVRLWALHSLRFDGLYGQDAYAYYYQGVALWREHLTTYHWPWLPRPIPFFWPLGEPALLAVLFAVAGHASAALAVAGSVGTGVLAVALVYGLALRVAETVLPWQAAPWAAMFAAAMAALGGLQVQASTTIMSDAPAQMWGLAAVMLWIVPNGRASRSVQLGGWVPPFAAGFCAALAVVTRWEYALLAPALLAYWGAVRAREHTPRPALHGREMKGGHRPSMRPLPAGATGALLPGVPQLLVSMQHSDSVLRHQWLVGWSLAHIWQAHFVTVDGAQNYPLSVGVFYLLRPLLSPLSLPATLAPFLVLGITALARTPGARPLLLLLLCWWLAPALYLAGVPYESDRFILIFLPAPAILEAIGFVTAVTRAARLAGTRYTRFHWWPFLLGILWAALSLGILAANARRPVAALAAGKVGDQAAVAWLQAHAPTGARIATFSLTLTLYHYGDLAERRWILLDLSAATPADLAHAARSGRLVVLANVENLAAQWRGLAPENAFEWLLAHGGVHRVDQVGPYTVFSQASALREPTS